MPSVAPVSILYQTVQIPGRQTIPCDPAIGNDYNAPCGILTHGCDATEMVITIQLKPAFSNVDCETAHKCASNGF